MKTRTKKLHMYITYKNKINEIQNKKKEKESLILLLSIVIVIIFLTISRKMVRTASHNNSSGTQPITNGLLNPFLSCLRFTIELIMLGLYTLYSIGLCTIKFFSSPKPKSLTNEIVLVTGGANGIGREICLQLAMLEPSITIISWDVNEEANHNLLCELKALDIKGAHVYTVDVSNRQQVEAGAKLINKEIGEVTMLFNNAGIAGELGNSWEISPEMVEKVLQINMISHFWTLQSFLPAMIEKGRGHIIETCSILGYCWGRHASPYIASKHGLRGYIEAVKEDLRYNKKTNILVSLVYPNNTITDLTAKIGLSSKSYPFLIPKMTPAFVASKIIEGVQTNEEHIYIPGYNRIAHMFLNVLPSTVVRRLIDVVKLDLAVRNK